MENETEIIKYQSGACTEYISNSTRVVGPDVQDLDPQMFSLSSPSVEPYLNDRVTLDLPGGIVVRTAAEGNID